MRNLNYMKIEKITPGLLVRVAHEDEYGEYYIGPELYIVIDQRMKSSTWNHVEHPEFLLYGQDSMKYIWIPHWDIVEHP